jgi:hypothetical protein
MVTASSMTAGNHAHPSLRSVISVIRYFFDIDESQARGPSALVRLSKTADLM